MKRRIRKRRVLKWVGVGLSITLLCIWGLELITGYHLRYGRAYISFNEGGVVLGLLDSSVPYFGNGFATARPFQWWPDGITYGGSMITYIPIWMLVLPSMFATLWLWRSDHRPNGGCLKCGYNLTGNISGVCPECGCPCKCSNCGYNLTGNVSGVCPECGTSAPVKGGTPAPEDRHGQQ